MNKRIKELLDQCTDQTMTKPWPLIDAEKFAELLILECANIADSAEPYLSSDLIKEHFGVE